MEGNGRHIAFYISSLKRGGAERVFSNLAAWFYGRGYRVTVVTPYRYPEEYPLPENVTRVLSDLTEQEMGGRAGNFFRRLRKLRRICRSLHADVMVSANGKNNLMALCANAFTPTKVVVSVVATPQLEYPTRLTRFLARWLFRFADGVVLQTAAAREFFPAAVQKKSVLLKNSLHPDFLRPRFSGKRQPEIVAVGRLDENKNHRMIVEAFSRVAGRFPDSRLTIYGDGPLREELCSLAESLGVSGRVLLPGAVGDVARRIEKAAVFVLSSQTEGMPNTLLEAMALGLCCISTDCPCGGPAALIRDGENGFLIPVGDTGALAKRLEQALGDPALVDRLGRSACRIQDEYAPERVNGEWESYLARVVGEGWLASRLPPLHKNSGLPPV